jgi:hypothetical protein
MWDLMNLLILLWNFFFLSVGIFFGIPFEELYVFSDGDLCKALYPLFLTLVLISQIVDLFLNFNTGFYKNGELVLDRLLIYKNYSRPGLYVDCLGIFTILLQFFGMNGIFKTETVIYWQLAFFVKYMNIKRIVNNFEDFFVNDDLWESVFSLIGLTIKTLGIAHIVACFWHGLAYFNSNYERTWIIDIEFIHSSWTSRYTFSIYWALTTMTTIGYGDISPKNEGEAILCMAVMMVGTALFGYMISSISSVLDKIEQKKRQLK